MGGRKFKRIEREKSIIIACDVDDLEKLMEIISNSYDLDFVGGYKIGLGLALKYGLPRVVSTIRKVSEKPIIYDHQKGGTDVLHTAKLFSKVLKDSNVDYAIIFPFSGPSVERTWIEELNSQGITPIVGGIMTLPDLLASAGGFLKDEAPLEIYRIAAEMKVRDFVLPGNNPNLLISYKKYIDCIVENPVYYLPGIGAQGGDLRFCSKIMGKNWHAIIGRSIYERKDVRKALIEYSKSINP